MLLYILFISTLGNRTLYENNIHKTFAELKEKGVIFKKDPVKTDYGYEAVFEDDNGNYIQLIKLI